MSHIGRQLIFIYICLAEKKEQSPFQLCEKFSCNVSLLSYGCVSFARMKITQQTPLGQQLSPERMFANIVILLSLAIRHLEARAESEPWKLEIICVVVNRRSVVTRARDTFTHSIINILLLFCYCIVILLYYVMCCVW